jgi:hypothetical protein
MGFKSSTDYRKDKYDNMLVLPNHGDSVELIIMYQSYADVMLADVHYLKTDDFSGYVHCLGKGCPTCNYRGPNGGQIRIQPKLFIPVYHIERDEIMFFDRSIKFESQLQTEVLNNYPNPSDYIFSLTRDGAAGSVDTKYAFVCKYNNTFKSYDEICKQFGITFPDYYSSICKSIDAATMSKMLSSSGVGNAAVAPMGDYAVTPRASSPAQAAPVNSPPPPTAEFVSGLEGDVSSDEEVKF